ncbi:MAG: ABC transporter ATP-binding protein [Sphingomonadales bacterium]|nr:MAG: ABC transporter ATP-binding protein [Sphingomonadales bacterium]
MTAIAPRWRSLAGFVRAFLATSGRARGWTAIAAVAGGALLEGFGLVLLLPILSVVFGEAAAGGRIGAALESIDLHGASQQLWFLLLVFAGVIVLRALVLYRRDTLLAELQGAFALAQRRRVIAALADAQWTSLARLEHARITDLLGSEIMRVGNATVMLVQIAAALAMLAVQAALAFSVAPALAAMVTGLSLLVAFPLHRATARSHAAGQGLHRASFALSHSVIGLLGGLKAAMAQGLQRRFVAGFEHVQQGLYDEQIAFVRLQARSRMIVSLAIALTGAAAIGLGVSLLSATPAVLVTMIVIFSRLAGPLLTIERALPTLAFNLPAFEAIGETTAKLTPRALVSAPTAANWGDIALHAVSFRHREIQSLTDADLRIADGETLGIAGPSGGGKTTLVDLIAGLLEPDAGNITIAGHALDAGTTAALRSGIAYAPQEPFLLHDTVRSNLSWSEQVDEPLLWDVLERMGAAQLVRQLPQGLDTSVGERGALLSGGERQRIVLARCLLRAPRLLILDEATSSLDLASEALILQAFRALSPRPTILLVSHRAESLTLCDRIVRVEGGRVFA